MGQMVAILTGTIYVTLTISFLDENWMVISVKGTVSMKLVDGNLNSANYQTMLFPRSNKNVEKI